jgi:DNA-binding response OmpR family regulator
MICFKVATTLEMNETYVLIMEYEDRVSRVLCRIIKRLGMESAAADNYSSFKELYKQYNPRVILLSLDSPTNNQAELCRYLVEQKTGATIILLSNMDEEKLLGFERTGRSAGLTMGGILRKPIDMTLIQSKLEELITPDQGNSFKKKVLSGVEKITERLIVQKLLKKEARLLTVILD